MNLVYGEVIEVLSEDGMKFGKIRVGGALKKVPLELLTDVKRGDTILVCDGVGISKVSAGAMETNDVPRDPR
ncbi:MAG: HypC/HybG/HupF family hydrogenase formation chaperone [Verrucomicrobiota bacterium]|nr:HypC/HybG/HupF family hydrogenase formation chaperone [Verrucomicrobiota bacterium]